MTPPAGHPIISPSGIPSAVMVFRILAISEFPKWRKYLISLSFRDKSSVRPVQVGGFEANIVVHRSTAVRGRGGPPPPWESSCRTRTGPVEADGTVDAPNAPTAPWKTLRVFHELPQGLSHRITHAKPRKAPKWRWETRIDPGSCTPTSPRLSGTPVPSLASLSPGWPCRGGTSSPPCFACWSPMRRTTSVSQHVIVLGCYDSAVACPRSRARAERCLGAQLH